MKRLLFVTIFMLLITGFIGCSKEGPQGAQGAKGDAGAVGAAGKDGSVIYAGTGAPSSSLGNAGDYYLDKSTDNLYGPKTSSGWGAALSLKGATGAAGAAGKNGSQILNGTGAPAASLGNTGDYYLDQTNYLLYGPKTASGWGGGLMLKGKDGNQFVNTYLFNKVTINATYTSSISLYVGDVYLTVPAISTDILSKGAVLIYSNFFVGAGSNSWTQLPCIEPAGLSLYPLNMSAGAVDIVFTSENDNKLVSDYRVVVIQGASETTLSAANPNVNFKDYNAVKKALHLGQ